MPRLPAVSSPVAGAAEDVVVAEVADHPVVVAGAAVDDVVAAPAVDQVAARPAADQVVAEAADDFVVAAEAEDHVAARGSAQPVRVVGADDRHPRPVAARDLFFLRRDGTQRIAYEEQRDEHRRHRGRSHAVSVRHPNE